MLQAFKCLVVGFNFVERIANDWRTTTLEVSFKALKTIVSD